MSDKPDLPALREAAFLIRGRDDGTLGSYQQAALTLADALPALLDELEALRADLARISKEFGLPPTIGPAPGEIKRREQLLRNYQREAEALRADLDDMARQRDQWKEFAYKHPEITPPVVTQELATLRAEVGRLEHALCLALDVEPIAREYAHEQTERAEKAEAEVELLRGQLRDCPTCGGGGVMSVLVAVHPPDEREEYADEQCAECGGHGLSSYGQMERDLAAARAVLDRAGGPFDMMMDKSATCISVDRAAWLAWQEAKP